MVDTCATRHICADQTCFTSLHGANGGSVLMRNGVSTAVCGIAQVSLKLTFDKTFVQKDVLFVPAMTRILLSGSILYRQGIKLVFESNKVLLTRCRSFVGKCYDCGGMFRISILDSSTNIFYSSNSNKNIDIWHSRLCHVNNEAIVHVIKMDLIPSYNYDKSHKCEVCVQAK